MAKIAIALLAFGALAANAAPVSSHQEVGEPLGFPRHGAQVGIDAHHAKRNSEHHQDFKHQTQKEAAGKPLYPDTVNDAFLRESMKAAASKNHDHWFHEGRETYRQLTEKKLREAKAKAEAEAEEAGAEAEADDAEGNQEWY